MVPLRGTRHMKHATHPRPPACASQWRGLWLGLVAAFVAVWAASAAHQPELLVFYANETSPEGAETANYQAFDQWLAALPGEKAQRVRGQLQRDVVEFRAAVGRETAALLAAPVDVVVFQNALARRGVFLWRPAGTGTNGVKLPFPELRAFQDPVMQANPLANPAGFEAALGAVKRLAASRAICRVGFLIKSHGSATLALTPRLARWHTEVRPEDVPALLEPGPVEPLSQLRGMTRDAFAQRLNAFQTAWGQPVEFVYLEACHAGANGPMVRERLQPGIRRYLAGKADPDSQHPLDYPTLLAAAGQNGSSFLSGLADALSQKPELVELRRATWRARLGANWPYFVPLLLVASWAAARLWKRRLAVIRPATSLSTIWWLVSDRKESR